jgi:hypothetical protein
MFKISEQVLATQYKQESDRDMTRLLFLLLVGVFVAGNPLWSEAPNVGFGILLGSVASEKNGNI